MSKLKIEKGASKVRRAPLKATIDGTIADDLELMCEWSDNESSYLVNLLLGFAIAQSEEFQQYKAERLRASSAPRVDPKTITEAARQIAPPGGSESLQIQRGVTA